MEVVIAFCLGALFWLGMVLGGSIEADSWELLTSTTLDDIKTQVKECESPLPRTESCVLEIKAVKKEEL